MAILYILSQNAVKKQRRYTGGSLCPLFILLTLNGNGRNFN